MSSGHVAAAVCAGKISSENNLKATIIEAEASQVKSDATLCLADANPSVKLAAPPTISKQAPTTTHNGAMAHARQTQLHVSK